MFSTLSFGLPQLVSQCHQASISNVVLDGLQSGTFGKSDKLGAQVRSESVVSGCVKEALCLLGQMQQSTAITGFGMKLRQFTSTGNGGAARASLPAGREISLGEIRTLRFRQHQFA